MSILSFLAAYTATLSTRIGTRQRCADGEPAPSQPVAEEVPMACDPPEVELAPPPSPDPDRSDAPQIREVPVEGPGATAMQCREDPEAEALNRKIAGLEARVAELAARKAGMDETLLSFQIAQYQALGATLETTLRLRLTCLRLQAARSGDPADIQAEKDAAADYQACQPDPDDAGTAQDGLDEADRAELRQRYRSAAMRCHPDRVSEADKAAAGTRFQKLQEAYRAGDLAALRAVCCELDGYGRTDCEVSLADIDALRRRLSDLQDHAADLILAVQSGQLDPAYRKALRPADWEAEFAEIRARLEGECEALQRRIATLSRS